MAKNKIIFGGEVQIDLTGDTATPSQILDGYTAHINTGEQVEGTCTFDADTSDATAQVAEILLNKTAYANGTKLKGTMPNNGAVTGTISTKAGQYTIPQGYHDGSGKVGIASTEQSKLISGNIKSGITILGVEGSYSGEAVSVETNKNATPSTTQQVITPSTGYDYLAQVTVAAIPYVETPNAHGTTVTIG